MRTARVVVLPYDEQWKADFEKIKAELEAEIGDLIIRDYSVFDAVVRRLAAIGYVHTRAKEPVLCGNW